MSKRILIVEDEPNIVESLLFLLERSGYKVFKETDGENAISRIRETTPDLIVLDVMLPNRSGFDILRELKQNLTEIKVLMLTAKGQNKDRQQAIEYGADEFMTKPFSNSEIVATVKAMLDER